MSMTLRDSAYVSNLPLLERLRALVPTAVAAELLALYRDNVYVHRAGDRLVAENECVGPRFVASGWVFQHRDLADGRRQVFGFGVAGDLMGTLLPHAASSPHAITAVTAVTTVDALPVLQALSPDGLIALHHSLAAQDRALLMNQVVRLGRLTATERIVHLLLELHSRLLCVKLATADTFGMPLTQELLADALGLSVVHVNRVLQQLRRERLIELHSGKVVLLQLEMLRDLADFSA